MQLSSILKNGSVPLQSKGDIIRFSGRLAHSVEIESGKRYVLTGFVGIDDSFINQTVFNETRYSNLDNHIDYNAVSNILSKNGSSRKTNRQKKNTAYCMDVLAFRRNATTGNFVHKDVESFFERLGHSYRAQRVCLRLSKRKRRFSTDAMGRASYSTPSGHDSFCTSTKIWWVFGWTQPLS